jgi:hypothetical protein
MIALCTTIQNQTLSSEPTAQLIYMGKFYIRKYFSRAFKKGLIIEKVKFIERGTGAICI